MIVYAGCYTDAPHPNGLLTLELEERNGAIVKRFETALDNPHYLAWYADGETLIADCTDGVAALMTSANKEPVVIDRVSIGGKSMCHVAHMPDKSGIVWADYSGGKVGIMPFATEKIGYGKVFSFTGSGPNLPRQAASHPHCAVPTPDGRHFAVCDLGLDTVTTLPDNTSYQTLPKGAGPRHIIYHPNGELAFVVFELGDMIASYRCSKDGRLIEMLDERHTVGEMAGKIVDKDAIVTTVGTAAAIRFSPDLKRVIVSNRKEHSLAAFDFDATTGVMRYSRTSILPGDWPRDFIFINDTLAMVAMERSGEIHSLRYHPETAEFEVIDTVNGLFRPIALLAKGKSK